MIRLERQSRSSNADDTRLDVGSSKLGVGVWDLGKGALWCSVGFTAEVVVGGDSETIVSDAVKRLGGTSESVGLDEQLSALAGVDTVRDILVVVVENVASTETERWAAGVGV